MLRDLRCRSATHPGLASEVWRLRRVPRHCRGTRRALRCTSARCAGIGIPALLPPRRSRPSRTGRSRRDPGRFAPFGSKGDHHLRTLAADRLHELLANLVGRRFGEALIEVVEQSTRPSREIAAASRSSASRRACRSSRLAKRGLARPPRVASRSCHERDVGARSAYILAIPATPKLSSSGCA